MIIKDSNFHILNETKETIIGHVFEYAYLINKINNEEVFIGDFYGDPAFGLISQDDDWCLIGGNILMLWKKEVGIIRIENEQLSWVLRARQVSETEVELLVDPRSKNGAVWFLNVQTLEKHKIREFNLDDGYFDEFDW